MGERTFIPVRIVRPDNETADGKRSREAARPEPTSPAIVQGDVEGRPQFDAQRPADGPLRHTNRADEPETTEDRSGETAQEPGGPESSRLDGAESWRERALRLQAEMDNYRRRQQRFAQHEIETDRRRLLLAFIRVIDDLERALNASTDRGNALRQGVELTYRAAMQLLEKEGVHPIQARGKPFDPAWHEAIATTDGLRSGSAPNTVVNVMEAGYRLGEYVLRPARVIVSR